ncbi:MAG: RNA-binding domain-containing protein, partial [Rhabdochlamydiaceae bacterium]
NYTDPEMIGVSLSALSNSAKRMNTPYGYLVYGVENATHTIKGTKFKPSQAEVKGQEWKMWTTQRLNPRVWLDIFEFQAEPGLDVSIIRVPHASIGTLTFNRQAHIRIGSYNQHLWFYPEVEQSLWAGSSDSAFEGVFAAEGLKASDAVDLLDAKIYFELTAGKEQIPENEEEILRKFTEEGFLHKEGHEHYAITNLGAMLLAKNIKHFPSLENKTAILRIFDGTNNLVMKHEIEGAYGYARAFEKIIKHILDNTPSKEIIDGAIRQEVNIFPVAALRELIANAFVHQDFTKPGRPTIEIFDDRIEFSNPGEPRVQSDLWVVESVARNERLANVL